MATDLNGMPPRGSSRPSGFSVKGDHSIPIVEKDLLIEYRSCPKQKIYHRVH